MNFRFLTCHSHGKRSPKEGRRRWATTLAVGLMSCSGLKPNQGPTEQPHPDGSNGVDRPQDGDSGEDADRRLSGSPNLHDTVLINGNCLGTLLTRDWVLTASHCTAHLPMAVTVAYEGVPYTSAYRADHASLDVALLKLTTKVTLMPGARLSNELWFGEMSALQGQSVVCDKWVDSRTVTTATFPVDTVLADTFALKPVALPGGGTQSLTQNDTGSACFFFDNGIAYIAGITSLAAAGEPSTQIGVASIREWVDDVIFADMALQLSGTAPLPGNAKAVAAADDLQDAWIIGNDDNVYRWNRSFADRWEQVGTHVANTIDVGRDLNALIASNKSILQWTGSAWAPTGLEGLEIGASQDGRTWIVGPDDVAPFGYIIRERVLTGPALSVWGAGDHIDGQMMGGCWTTSRFHGVYRNQRAWMAHGGLAKDVAIGSDLPTTVWIIGSVDGAAYRWNLTHFERFPASGGPVFERITVDDRGVPWATNIDGRLQSWNGTGWDDVPTPERPVDVKFSRSRGLILFGESGSFYVLKGTSWANAPGSVRGIAFAYESATDTVWVVQRDNTIVKKAWAFSGVSIMPVPVGATDIGGSGGNNEPIWITGTDLQAYHWNKLSGSWESKGGSATRVDVGFEGQAWIVGSDSHVYSIDWDLREVRGVFANEIATGMDDSVWAVGIDGFSADGNQVFLWNETKWLWQPQGFGAKKVAVGPSGRPWITTESNTIKKYDGTTWSTLPSTATDISTGADGRAWIVEASGDKVFRYNGGGWQPVAGPRVTEIDVDAEGKAWIVDDGGNILFGTGSGWTSTASQGSEIGVAPTGAVWRVGPTPRSGGHSVEKLIGLTPLKWQEVSSSQGGSRVDVDLDGNAWICDSSERVYRWSGSAWVAAGTTSDTCVDVAVGSSGTSWKVNREGELARWNGAKWIADGKISGDRLSAGAMGKVIVRNSSGSILVR